VLADGRCSGRGLRTCPSKRSQRASRTILRALRRAPETAERDVG
jgi:hypothetical protein